MDSDEGVAKWTEKIVSPTPTHTLPHLDHSHLTISLQYKYGFSFVSGCPITPSATQSLLERIAFIRHTHYGGFWDFTSSNTPTDTAYTNQPLAVHNDTTYLTDTCGLQMFHLLSHTDGIGGESLFVDGYAAAAHLRDNEPSLYAYLCRQRILYHACGNTEVGELDNAGLGIGGARVFHGGMPRKDKYFARIGIGRESEKVDSRIVPVLIRWNNDDRDAQTWRSLNSLERWHRAAREWDKILKMRQFEIKVQLRPGQPVIFNNWRYLHGRTGFSGKRRMCGGYINMDDFLARYRMTNFGPRNGLNRQYFYERKQQLGKPAPYLSA